MTSDASAGQESPLARVYVAGEAVRYRMTGINQGRTSAMRYSAECEGRVVRSEDARFVEEIRWTRLEVNGEEVPLDEASRSFVQVVSLDAGYEMTPPDISRVNPMLIGPILDLMTFYVDLHPSLRQGRLVKAGDQARVAHAQPNSWADGTRVIVGEDCIDFELALTRVDADRAELQVRHVPPGQACVRLAAPWMREPVNSASGVSNNWVQVEPDAATTPPGFVAAVGHEVFDVRIEIERPSGRIVAATMDNPVDVVQRKCKDAALHDCGAPVPFRIHRRIELRRCP